MCLINVFMGFYVKMFVLVEFRKEDGCGLAIVSEKWPTPRKKEVFWPPVKDQRLYDKILKEEVQADAEWKLFNITRHFYETDNFEKAQAKVKLAEFTSDLASNTEVEKKRKRFSQRPRRFSSSEDEDNLSLKRPPLLFKERTSVDIQNSSLELQKSKSRLSFSLHQDVTGAEGSSTSCIQNDESSTSNLDLASNSPKTPYCRQTKLLVSKNAIQASGNENTPTAASGDIINNTSGFQRKLFSKLILIEEQNKEILEILKEKFVSNELVLIYRLIFL